MLHFCQPLSSVVWLLLLTALSVVTANVYIVERLSPPHPPPPPLAAAATAASRALINVGDSGVGASSTAGSSSVPLDDDPAPESRLTLQDTVWFTVSALLLRHSTVCPRTVAGRIATTGLHLFSLVVMLSYAANMAALLTTSRRSGVHSPPSGIEPRTIRELLERRDVRFSTVRQSDVSALLEGSADPNVRRVWERIKDNPAGFVERPELGRGDPAGNDRCFVWDSAPIRYAVAQNCGLMTEMVLVAETKRYALGVPQGAVYRDKLNMAILTLHEKGTLHALHNK